MPKKTYKPEEIIDKARPQFFPGQITLLESVKMCWGRVSHARLPTLLEYQNP